MAQCGLNLGSQIALFLVSFAIFSNIPTGFGDYADDVQHGGIENWFFDDETGLFYPDILDEDTWSSLGHLNAGVAKVGVGHDDHKGVEIASSKDGLLEMMFQGNQLNPGRQVNHQKRKVVKRSPDKILLKSTDVPVNCLIFFQLNIANEQLSASQEENLVRVLSETLNVPKGHVFIDHKILTKHNIVAVYVVNRDTNNPSVVTVKDLIPAHQLQKNLIVNQLKSKLPDIQIEDVFTTVSLEDRFSRSSNYAAHSEFYLQTYFPYVVACAGVVFITLVISLTWFCAFRTPSKSSHYSITSPTSSSQSSHIPQQICTLFPAGKPDVHNPTHIQPNVSHVLSSRSLMGGGYGSPHHGSISPLAGSISPRSVLSGTPCSSPSSGTPLTGSSTPIHTPPMKIRAKLGLLERRGSNASLTIDLGPTTQSSQDTGSSWGSPPRESSAEEYLLSAGNRMSRKQLRSCLKNVRAIHEEFWEIPMNHPDRIEVAGSGMKNRYRTIIPNEETRVKLSDTEDDSISSYINANYIRGYGSEPHSYIATQGPMSNTVADFWLMVWREKAPIIVMITKLREKNRTKCESYLPEVSTKFGDVEVTTNSISERNGYILRNLTVKCGGIEHKVNHYWYTAWPDHKAPNTAKTLLELVKLVNQQRYDSQTGKVKGPVVVHCSAGIGRTGCFIAASIGIQQLRCEHMVDILGIICSMRIDRGGMIQTNEQYEFIHQILCLFERELPERPPANGEE